MKHTSAWVSTLVALALVSVPIAIGQTFTFKNIEIPSAQSTTPWGINDSGVISGNYTDSSGVVHCFMLSGHTITAITDPKGTSTSCFGINASGAIVGFYGVLNGFSNGFVYQGGVFSDIIVPTATAGTIAYGINDSGDVVGQFSDSAGTHGFLFNGSYETLNAPGATVTIAVGINNSGLITLQSVNSGGVSSWVLIGTHYVQLNVPGAVTTAVHSINNLDEIAFSWFDLSGLEHGAVRAGTTYHLIDDPAGTGTGIETINDNKIIVGKYVPAGGSQAQGFEGRP
jgi:hypothetical protein